jgi:uncharacterized protein
MRYGRIVAGVLCLALGVAGLFLPFVQGILLLVVGLTLLSTESEMARRWLEWLRARVRRKGHDGDGAGWKNDQDFKSEAPNKSQ